jgi:hypothetical protein
MRAHAPRYKLHPSQLGVAATASSVLSLSSTNVMRAPGGALAPSAASTSLLGRPDSVCEKMRSIGKYTPASSFISRCVKRA